MKKNTFAVIGLGTFGSSIAKVLSRDNQDVLVIDQNEERVEDLSEFVTKAVVGDASEEKTLRSLGIADIETVIVSTGDNMENSVLITLLLKDMGVKRIIAKGINELHAKILDKVGADRIVFPEHEIAEKLANELLSPNILEQIEVSDEYNIIELVVPQSFIHRSIIDIDCRARFGVNIIAIKHKEPFITESGESDFKEKLNISPSADTEIEEGDVFIVIGRYEDLKRLKEVS